MSLKSEFEKAVNAYKRELQKDYAREIILKGYENAIPPKPIFTKLSYEQVKAGVTRYKYENGERKRVVYTGEEAVKIQTQSLRNETKEYTSYRRYINNLEKLFASEGVLGTKKAQIILNRLKHGDISKDMLYIMDKEGSLINFSGIYSNIENIDDFMDELLTNTNRANQVRLQDIANDLNAELSELYGIKAMKKRKRNIARS